MTGRSLRGPLVVLLLFVASAGASRGAEETLARALEVFSESGLKGTSEGLAKAQEAYSRAKRLAPGDGRVDYAWSIVLTRNRKFTDSEEAFQKALAARPVCLPAHLANFRNALRTRKYDAAAEQMIELAEIAGDASLTHITPADRNGAARCLGRGFAFLTGPLADLEVARMVERRESALRTYLGPAAAAFDEGQQSLSLEHRKLQDELAVLIDSAEDKKVEALRAETEKLAKVETGYKSASAETANSQKALQETVADLDAKLTGLQKQFTKLAETEQTLMTTIVGLEQNIITIQLDLDRVQRTRENNPRLNTAGAELVLGQKLMAMGVELDLTRNSLLVVQAQKDSVLKTAMPLMQQRTAGRSAQQQLSGTASQLSANLQRWQKTIQEQSRKISETPVERTGRLPAIRQKMQSWGTYDRNDPAQELAAALGSS